MVTVEEIKTNSLIQSLLAPDVTIDGVDHIIAVPPRMWVGNVARWSGRFPIPGDIQPVPAPTLGESLRLHQTIHDALKRVCPFVGQVGF